MSNRLRVVPGRATRGPEAALAHVYVATGSRPMFEIWRNGRLLAEPPEFTEALRHVRAINRKGA